MNADILRGPYKAENIPVDPVRFLAGCKFFPNATLSLGWTTYFNETYKNESYTQSHVGEMLSLIKANNLQSPVTFPVRAVFASNDIENMKALVEGNANHTITIWSGQSDIVDIPKLKNLILSVGLNKTYLDVPKEVSDNLHLDSGSSSSGPTLLMATVSIFMYFIMNKLF